jgi:hypothetical protein
MTHTKKLDQEPTHVVLTVEDIEEDKVEQFRGSRRECESWIKISGLITLTIEEIL